MGGFHKGGRLAALLVGIALLAAPVSAETTTNGTTTAATTTDAAATTASQSTTSAFGTTTVGTTTVGTTDANDTTTPTEPEKPAVPTEPRIDSVCYSDGTAPQAVWYEDGLSRPLSEAMTTAGRNGGQALSFNGSDYIQVDIRDMDAPFTLSLWANWQATSLSDAAEGQRLFTVMKSGTENAIFCSPLTKRPTEGLNGILLSSVCYLKKDWQRQLGFYPTKGAVSNALSPNDWHHVALTVNEQTVALYVDGVLWKEQVCGFTFGDLGADTLFIGAGENGACGFTGLMEKVEWYAGLLTATQIARLAQDADPFDPTVSVTPSVYTPAENVAEPLTEKHYIVLTDNGKTVITTDTAVSAFWEMPQLNAGESVSGTLFLENKSKGLVTARLETGDLPKEAYSYLSELQISVTDGEKLLFSGPYTDITAAAFSELIGFENAAYGRVTAYTVTVSRPLTAKEPAVSAKISWGFSCELTPVFSEQPNESKEIWLICLLFFSAAIVAASVYWATVRRQRRLFTVWDTVAASCRKVWMNFSQKRRKKSDETTEDKK